MPTDSFLESLIFCSKKIYPWKAEMSACCQRSAWDWAKPTTAACWVAAGCATSCNSIHLYLRLATGEMEFTGGPKQDGVLGFLIKRGFSLFLISLFFQWLVFVMLKTDHYFTLLHVKKQLSFVFHFRPANVSSFFGC